MKPNVKDLRWVRVFTPVHIPRKYVEQISNRDFSVDDFFSFQEVACLRQTPEGPTLNPLSHLYVLVNTQNETHGFLWFTIDPLTKDMVIQIFSVDKAYWGKGAIEKLADFAKEIRTKANLNKIYWITNYPKHSERHGFKRSNSILMEYTEDEKNGENSNGGSLSDRDSGSTESRAEELPIECVRAE